MSTLLTVYWVGFVIYLLGSLLSTVRFIPVYKKIGLIRSALSIIHMLALNFVWPTFFLNSIANLFLPKIDFDLHDLQDHLDSL